MCTWRTHTTVPCQPAGVLGLFTEPEAIAQWSLVPFEILELAGRRLVKGSRARVAGRLADRLVEFEIVVLDASEQKLALLADGPVSFAVQHLLRPGGSSGRREHSTRRPYRVTPALAADATGRALARVHLPLLAIGLGCPAGDPRNHGSRTDLNSEMLVA